MMENTKKNEPKMDPKIEAIKEIIFGENIKEYEYEFKKITELIKNHKEELEKKLEEFRAEAKSLIENANKEVAKQLDEMKKSTQQQLNELENTKTNKQALGDMFKQMAEQIQA